MPVSCSVLATLIGACLPSRVRWFFGHKGFASARLGRRDGIMRRRFAMLGAPRCPRRRRSAVMAPAYPFLAWLLALIFPAQLRRIRPITEKSSLSLRGNGRVAGHNCARLWLAQKHDGHAGTKTVRGVEAWSIGNVQHCGICAMPLLPGNGRPRVVGVCHSWGMRRGVYVGQPPRRGVFPVTTVSLASSATGGGKRTENSISSSRRKA